MKKLVFDYEMKLSFSSPVTDHRFQLRCIPATGPRQQVIDVAVKIEPDVELETTIDSFDSVVMTGFIPEPHTMFNYSVTGIAFVDNAHIKSEIYKPLYRFNSALTVPGPAIEALIGICRERIASLPADCTPIDQAREVMDEVFKTFVYTPASTTIRTTAEEAFAQRKGVCQDYAHVMLSVCRQSDSLPDTSRDCSASRAPRTHGSKSTMMDVGSVWTPHTTVWSTTTTSPSPMAAITATACSTSASSPAATSSRTSGSTLPCTSRDTDSPTFSRCRIPYFGRCKADKQKRPKRHCFNLHCMRIRRDSNSRRGSPSHAFEACSLDRSDTYPFVT